jgi:catechol 2,3-dioxygenase-like lactoylglutathione lyase family enzyme
MPTVSHGAPIFAVTDLAVAIDFYRKSLGFTLQMQTNDPMPYAIMSRDDVAVHLTVDDSRRGKGAMYAMTDDVDGLHDELVKKGVRIVEPPDDRVYGMRDMYFNDCCGNMIGFGQMLSG